MGNSRVAELLALLLLELLLLGFGAGKSSALPVDAPSSAPVSLVQHLWPYGVPGVLK